LSSSLGQGLGFGPGSTQAKAAPDDPQVAELREWSDRADDLSWLSGEIGSHPWLADGQTRTGLLQQEYGNDPIGTARATGVLAAEAQLRANLVLERWGRRVDRQPGLMPRGVAAEDQVWD